MPRIIVMQLLQNRVTNGNPMTSATARQVLSNLWSICKKEKDCLDTLASTGHSLISLEFENFFPGYYWNGYIIMA